MPASSSVSLGSDSIQHNASTGLTINASSTNHNLVLTANNKVAVGTKLDIGNAGDSFIHRNGEFINILSVDLDGWTYHD